jgi:hypothetical protein
MNKATGQRDHGHGVLEIEHAPVVRESHAFSKKLRKGFISDARTAERVTMHYRREQMIVRRSGGGHDGSFFCVFIVDLLRTIHVRVRVQDGR